MKKGFTLIELLGVIIILALIMILVFPSVINFIKKGNDAIDDATLKLIYNAADLYVRDKNIFYYNDPGATYCLSFKKLFQSNYLNEDMLNEFDYKNKIIKMEYGIDNYEIVDKNICETSICKVNTDDLIGESYKKEQGLTYGNAIKCMVNDKLEYNFYVLKILKNDIYELIMDRTICEDGTPSTIKNKCLSQWATKEDYCEGSTDENCLSNAGADKGPLTAIKTVTKSTSTWTNLMKINEKKYSGYAKLLDNLSNTGCGTAAGGFGCKNWILSGLTLMPYDKSGRFSISGINSFWVDIGGMSKTLGRVVYYNGSANYSDGFGNNGIKPVIKVSDNQIIK